MGVGISGTRSLEGGWVCTRGEYSFPDMGRGIQSESGQYISYWMISFCITLYFLASLVISNHTWFHDSLLPANKVCEGYVFTGVCLSTGGGHAYDALRWILRDELNEWAVCILLERILVNLVLCDR